MIEVSLAIALAIVYFAGMMLMWLFGDESHMWAELKPKHVPKHCIIATMMILWAPLILYAVFWGLGTGIAGKTTEMWREARTDWREGRRH